MNAWIPVWDFVAEGNLGLSFLVGLSLIPPCCVCIGHSLTIMASFPKFIYSIHSRFRTKKVSSSLPVEPLVGTHILFYFFLTVYSYKDDICAGGGIQSLCRLLSLNRDPSVLQHILISLASLSFGNER